MATVVIRSIVRLGDPVLRTPARPVETERVGWTEIAALVDDLFATMRDANGVGLAAPQVGIPLQVFVYEVPGEEEEAPVRRAIVNPMVEAEGGELVEDWEGCLSIPDLRGLVPRHRAVRLRGLDPHGRPLDVRADGFEARVIQHESDHLQGVVFLDRMRSFESLGYGAELDRCTTPAAAEPVAVG